METINDYKLDPDEIDGLPSESETAGETLDDFGGLDDFYSEE